MVEKVKKKSTANDRFIVLLFLVAALWLSNGFLLVGVILISLGIYWIRRQDKISILQDEVIPGGLYAGFWLRTCALLIDWGIYYFIGAVGYFLLGERFF